MYALSPAHYSLHSQELDLLLGSNLSKTAVLEESMSIRILVVGKSGVGKSTIVNALVGMNIAKPNEDVVSVTEEVEEIVGAKNGVHVYIIDTPGLRFLDVKDDNTLHLAVADSEDVDLFLFCLKMTERLDSHHIEEIKAITSKFGEDIWKKGLFVLTFANEFNDKKRFASKLHEWENQMRIRISKIIDPGEAEKIPIVPTGYKEPQLPDRPSWVSEFWIQGVRRMNFKVRYYMTLLNMERIRDEKKEMCGNSEEQPLVTCYMLKEKTKYADPKHTQVIGQTLSPEHSLVSFYLLLFLVFSIILLILLTIFLLYIYYMYILPLEKMEMLFHR